jgi:hypothetical protein
MESFHRTSVIAALSLSQIALSAQKTVIRHQSSVIAAPSLRQINLHHYGTLMVASIS